MKKIIFVFLLSVFTCANAADDNSWEGDDFMPGPGVFSGDKGEIDLTKLFSLINDKEKKAEEKVAEPSIVEKKAEPITPVAVESEIKPESQVKPVNTVKSNQAYESFQAAKENAVVDPKQMEDYQEFLEYKKFLEWKRLNGG